MLGKALKLIRIFHAMSQTELAEKLAMSKSHISGIESTRRKCSIELLFKYADEFEIPLSSILFLAENLEGNKIDKKTRVCVSRKVVDIMDWISNAGITEDIKSTLKEDIKNQHE